MEEGFCSRGASAFVRHERHRHPRRFSLSAALVRAKSDTFLICACVLDKLISGNAMTVSTPEFPQRLNFLGNSPFSGIHNHVQEVPWDCNGSCPLTLSFTHSLPKSASHSFYKQQPNTTSYITQRIISQHANGWYSNSHSLENLICHQNDKQHHYSYHFV